MPDYAERRAQVRREAICVAEGALGVHGCGHWDTEPYDEIAAAVLDAAALAEKIMFVVGDDDA